MPWGITPCGCGLRAERIRVDWVVGGAELFVNELGRGRGFSAVAAGDGEAGLAEGGQGGVKEVAPDSSVPVFHQDARTGHEMVIGVCIAIENRGGNDAVSVSDDQSRDRTFGGATRDSSREVVLPVAVTAAPRDIETEA